MPGMLLLSGSRIKTVNQDQIILDRGYVTLDESNNWKVQYSTLDKSDLPDITDYATTGCMIEVLYRATGLIQSLVYIPQDKIWSLCMYGEDSCKSFIGCSQETALLAAFESLD
jgi:hypothetical protein